jgi:leader peptidase (prepilin peptidase)/N-methyltransferase
MEVVFLICFFILGAVLGSFYNVLGMRIPNHESIVKPRSHCEKCGHVLCWYELIPIVSFLILRGKCRNCKTKLSWLYLFSEVFCGLLFAISYYSFGFSWNLFIVLTVSSLMILVTVSDLNYMIIPDRFIIISAIIILLVKLVGFGFNTFLLSFGYGLLAFVFMFGVMKLGSFIFKKEALGGADVKLMFIAGICVEPFLTLLVIIIASVVALPVSLFLLYKEKENIIPFGPFLVIGILIILFTKLNSQEIINLILKL